MHVSQSRRALIQLVNSGDEGGKKLIRVGAKLYINPEIIRKLSSGNRELWCASHADGSDNRINGGAIADAATVSTSLGIISAVFQGIRKAFRNRGKTKEDLLAEKEAVKINKSCDGFDLMLRDYLRAAQEGSIETDDLDDLIEMLEEMEEYVQHGKLTVRSEQALAETRKSIVDFTAAMMGGQPGGADGPSANQFRQIREQLLRQKDWIGKKAGI